VGGDVLPQGQHGGNLLQHHRPRTRGGDVPHGLGGERRALVVPRHVGRGVARGEGVHSFRHGLQVQEPALVAGRGVGLAGRGADQQLDSATQVCQGHLGHVGAHTLVPVRCRGQARRLVPLEPDLSPGPARGQQAFLVATRPGEQVDGERLFVSR
jgi:hypothetical protein